MSACPQGSPEAEAIYQEARKYWWGQEGYPLNPEKAEELFEKAMFMGNSKAPLGIGALYMWAYSGKYKEENRHKYMVYMYNESIKMGCAEGYVFLAECYSNGWGVPMDYKKAIEELKKTVAMDSPMGLEQYGRHLIDEEKRVEEGRKFLRKSMALGNGDAGFPLANSYLGNDDDRMYAALRNGAKLGSLDCLGMLAHYYRQGVCGQKNMELYNCVTKVEEGINWFHVPKPIENFDELCPHPTPLNVTP